MKKSLCLIALLVFTASVSAQITSTFDTDADGWTFYNASFTSIAVTHNLANGNPGGYISATYASNSGTTNNNTNNNNQVWFAPTKFLGNHLVKSLGMHLKFDLQQSQAGTLSGVDVVIQNAGNYIYFNLPVKPAVAPAWSSYSLPLDETISWFWNSTVALATRSQIIGILTNVTSIEIRGTYATNAAYTSGLDNVILEQRILTPAPVATSLSATSGKPGDVITITGSGFDANPSNNSVSFGVYTGTKAVVQSATATQLIIQVPQGAVYGSITITNTTTGLTSKTLTPFNPVFDGGGRIIPASFKSGFTISTIPIEGWFVGDFDGDGWEDFAVANNDVNDVIDIYRNLGLGGNLSAASFAAKVSVPMPPLGGSGANGTGLWFADLDGDGKIDAVSSTHSGSGSAFVTFRNTSTPGSITFEAPEYWSGGSDETPIALVSDFDGDGRPELLAGEGSFSSTAFSYFWINQNLSTPGNIEFAGPVFPFNGTVVNAFAVATAGDLDGDGKNELVITHNFGQVFTVLKNTSTPGVPSFTNAFTITTNQYNTSIHVADMNLDGKNDLVYKISGEAGIHIRLNANSGGALVATDFTSDVIISGDLNTQGGISLVDFNGDGKLDIAATDNTDVGVYENIYAGGVFDPQAFVPAYQVQGGGSSSPRVSDLNRDGKPDLVSATGASIIIVENKNIHAPAISLNTVSPLKGSIGSTVTITGNDFSTIPSENIVWFGAVKATVLSASENLLTVAVPAGATYAPISVTKNGLTSRYHLPFQTTFSAGVSFDNTHFAPSVNFTLSGAGYNIEAGDMNIDGRADILASAGNTAYAFRNDFTTGAITTTTLVANDTLSPTTDLFGNPRLEDFDGDGYLDVASVNTRVRKNITTGSNINFSPNITYTGQGNLAYADFNQDGKMDIAVSNSFGAQLNLFENRTVPGNFTTTGTYGSFSSVFAFAKPGTGGEVVAADFDADGFPDVITVNITTDNISIFRNVGGIRITTVQFAARVDIAVGDMPNRVYKGDFDSDGKLDLMLYHAAGTTSTLLIVLHNTSTTGNISFNRIDLTNPSATTVSTIADLDGDGKPEIITTSESGNRFSIFKNIHTSGALTAASFAAPFNTTVTAPRGITTGDLNLDGKPEIILTRAAGLLVVYENIITSILPPTITSFTPTSGPVGTTVTINGTNFDTTPTNNIVYFGATRALVTIATATQLTVTVPTGATYAPISVLNIASGLLAYSMSNFTPTFIPIKANITNGDFEPKIDFPTGALPYSVTIGDLDGDGKADLAVANANSNSLSIFRNTSSAGTIGYAASVNLVTGGSPFSVSIGDLDGDGKPDLAVANQFSGSVSVFRNTGSTGTISYAAKVDFVAGGGASTVAIGDLDGDGKADLATANFSGDNISVFRNTSSVGTISYAAKVDFTAGNDPYPLSIGDLDGDGKADIVVANQISNSISIFRNTSSAGTISYAAKVDFTTGTNPTSVSIGDLDGDGKADLAVANGSSNTVSVFRNTSTIGSISYAAKVDIATGAGPAYVSIGDLNGDGKADLAITNYSSATVSIFRNTGSSGTISYAAKVDFTTGTGPAYVSIGDLDGDERPDLAVANYNSNTVSVIRSYFVLPPTITSFTPNTGPVGTTVTITGTNFDTTPINNIVYFGATRAVVTIATATQLTVTVPTGATYQPITVQVGGLTAYSSRPFVVTFAGGAAIDNCSFAPATSVGTVSTFSRSAIFDVDGNGKTDLLIPDQTNNQIAIFRNTSTAGTSSFAPVLNVTGLNIPLSVALGDVDSDGNPDMVVVNYTNGKLSVYKNLSTSGTISFASKVDFTIPSFSHDVTIADIDGDGKQDLTVITSLNGLIVFRNTGTPGVINASTFAAGVTFTTGPNAFPAVLGDIDGDGKLDAAVPNANAYTVSLLRNTSTPGVISFATQTLTIAAGTPSLGLGAGITLLGDIDGDTKLDLVVTVNTFNTVSIYRNTSTTGSISFDPKFDIAFPSTSYTPAISDLDGDGKIDLAIDRNATGLSIYKNTATSGVINASSFAPPVLLTRSASGMNHSGDIDGDGRNDIISTSTNVQVFRNLVGTISVPTITSFSPTSGLVGTSVTITGTNFGTIFSKTVEFNGTAATIASSTSTTLTVIVPVGATTGPIKVTIGCNSITGSTFTVSLPATITITTQPSDFIACVGQTAAFTTAATGTTNIVYQWQFSPDGILPFSDIVNGGGYSTATTPALSINTTGNFGLGRYRCRINGDLAAEVISNAQGLLINPLPAAPGTIGNSGCSSTSISLTATGASPGEFRWYTVASGGTALTGEVNSTYSTPAITTMTTYYAAINNGTCESTRTAVTATILPLPVQPSVMSGVGCAPSASIVLTASGGSAGQYRWYTTSTGGSAIVGEINGTYVTPMLASTTTFHVSINNGTCESLRTPAVAEIRSCTPTIAPASLTSQIGGQTTLDITPLITTISAPIDIASIKVTQQPFSGAIAIVEAGVLEIDYSGVEFVGTDVLRIEACDLAAHCSEEEITIEVVGTIGIYNALSPNGDGKNEIFLLEYIDLLPDTKQNKVTILNRWGTVVFTIDNYDNQARAFRGLSDSGNELPTGTYYYRIDYTDGQSSRTGYLSLRR